MKKYFVKTLLVIILLASNVLAQKLEQPKLIVGIVVDQMRFNDLYRYYNLYSENGFKRLMNNGSNFINAYYNYVPTNTGPGHASIYTGTTPYFHGIINNDFYDRVKKKFVNCVQDDEVTTIGSDGSEGKKSPKNLLATTITDALKIFTNKKSKVYSFSIKDRGAILPAGHLADGAFWYDTKSGKFISSSFYLTKLPNWVEEFNRSGVVDKYISQTWNLLLDKKHYEINSPDESPFEPDFFNEGKTSFPHSLNNLNNEEKYNKLAFTPFINEILIELVKKAVIEEKLGKNSVPDFINISFSSTDLIGHTWGNNSYELMDTYLRLDLQLADFLSFLDKEIGKGNYLLFLTSDHGAIETPAFLKANKIPTGELSNSKILDSLKAFCIRNYGSEKVIEAYSYGLIYLDKNFIKMNKLDYFKIEEDITHYLRTTFPEILKISKRSYLENLYPYRENPDLILNGWNPAKSADIVFNLIPGYLFKFLNTGTTHGSQYAYDTHVPIIFYGWKVPTQIVTEKVYIVDIAPTIASLIRIAGPNASMGKVIINR